MSKIRVLPDTLANKIAAGEVVERPASVVKELLENSLDAGAKRIRVETDAGGKKFIKITDDGEGMSRDDAMLAFERHATSKLRDINDLESIRTLGFRGEALPSIASIAKVSLRTKTASELEGTEIEIAGGRMLNVNTVAWPGGTEMEIKELFFNVPARRKFLKSDATEAFHIANLITHYALANPAISFSLLQNGRELISASPVDSLRDRAYQLFGDDMVENLIEINAEGEINIHGFISKPQEQRASRDSQYLFVNGRFVRDRLLARAISEAYKNVIPPGTYPSVMLMIEMLAEEVDVNVHPAKTEVRFRRPYVISEAVTNAIKAAFTRTKPFADFPIKTEASRSQPHTQIDTFNSFKPVPSVNAPTPFDKPVQTFDTADRSTLLSQLPEVADPFETTNNALPPASISNSSPSRSTPSLFTDTPAKTPAKPLANTNAPQIAATNSSITAEKSPGEKVSATPLPYESEKDQAQKAENSHQLSLWEQRTANREEESSLTIQCAMQGVIAQAQNLPIDSVPMRPLGQLRDSYIIAVDSQGLVLIDQHVAHERILFEYHLSRIKSQELEQQRLLIPETIDLTPAQFAAFQAISENLTASGFELMSLSGRTIAIQAAPALLTSVEARKLVMELISVVEKDRRELSLEDFQREIAASMACRAAIKVNMPLSEDKMQWLIDELWKTESPTNCPHGRPVILRFSMREIEKGFKRI